MTSTMTEILCAANTVEPLQYSSLMKKDDGKLCPDGASIRRMRKQRGYSRERLAALTGIAIKTLRNLETRPSYRCRPCTIGILAQHYGVEPSTFIMPEETACIRLLTSTPEIIEAKAKIVTSAKSTLACVGSRSRHEGLLRLIELNLRAKPDLVHYRAMFLPPFKKEFQDHLLNTLRIRDEDRTKNTHQKIHVGIYDCLVKQSEAHVIANETTALVMLPCVSGIGSQSTAVLLEDPVIARKYIELIKALYRSGRKIETEQDIFDLGIVNEDDHLPACH